MPYYTEGFRYDTTFLAPASGSDARLIPQACAVVLARKGATVTVPGSGSGNQAVSVSDPGTIVPGDTVQLNGQGTVGTVQASGYTSASIVVNWPVSASWIKGDRLTVQTPGSAPVAYTDPFLSDVLAQPIAFGSGTGRASFYTRERDLDYIVTVGATVSVVPDVAGFGGRVEVTPQDAGARWDGTTNDAVAINNRLTWFQARGRGVLELQPGDGIVGSTLTFTNIVGLKVRGYGKGVTRLLANVAAGNVLSIGSGCRDVVFEDMTIGRTLNGSAHLILVQAGAQRTVFRRCHFLKGSHIVLDQGTDTAFDDCSADGDGWAGGLAFLSAKRPKVRTFVARYANSLGAGIGFIDVDQATESPRIDLADVAPSDLALYTGTALIVRLSGGVTAPKDVLVANSKFVGGDLAGVERPAVIVSNGEGITFSEVTTEDSLNGYAVSGGDDVTWHGGRVAGIAEHGMTITNCLAPRIIGLASSDVGEKADGVYDHVHMEFGTGLLYPLIHGLLYGNYLRGSPNRARHVVFGDPSIRLMASAVHGYQSFISGDIFNGFDFDQTTLSHYREKVGAFVDIPPLHDVFRLNPLDSAGANPDVARRGYVRFTNVAPINVTNFTNGHEGQLLYIVATTANAVNVINGATIATRTGADVALVSGKGMALLLRGTVWAEV